MRGQAWWVIAIIFLIAQVPIQPSIAEDPYPPEVRWIMPEDGSNLPPGIVSIEVNFTEAMNLTTMENALTIQPHVEYHLWFWTLDNTTFFYRTVLDPGTYQVTLVETVQDINGTEMGSPYSWSYHVREDNPQGFTIPGWVGFLPGTLPFVLILLAWYIYERKKKRRLSYQQQERLKVMEPKTFDTYTIITLALLSAVMALFALYFVFRWDVLFILIGILGPAAGLMAFIGFIYGMSSGSRLREQVEREAYGYPPASPELISRSEKLELVKVALIVGIFILFMYTLILMIPVPGRPFDPYPILFFGPIFGALIALYVFISRLEASSKG